MTAPLSDVRIVAIEQYGAGPWGSVHLADMGAEVIKVEQPAGGGDISRYVPPYQEDEDSLFFETFNRNKRSLNLDIRTQSGRRILHDVVRVSDAVYSNLRGDVPKRLGITYDTLKHVNPAIVCCSLSAYGMGNSRSAAPGYDYIMQGLAGWMSVTGEPDGPPTKTGLSLVDFSGGFVGALALMVGLHAARRDGVGMDCDVSLYDTAMSLLTYPATWHLSAGYQPVRTRHSAHPSLVPFQNFRTSDGWIVVGCAKEKFWERLVTCLSDERLQRPTFATFTDRQLNAPQLLDVLTDIFVDDATDVWIARLEDAGVPCGKINTIPEALENPLVQERELIHEFDHARWGTVRSVSSPIRVGAKRPAVRRAPTRGEDNDRILREMLGYDETAIEECRRDGAFG